MAYGGSDQQGVEHWWRQIHYVFDLPDPRLFPSLPVSALAEDELDILSRFSHTAVDLAGSQMLTFDARLEIAFDDATDEPAIAGANLPGRDIQSGFAVLLRQCLSAKDSANYDAAAKIIGASLDRSGDGYAVDRREELSSWTTAIKRLRGRSLEQLVRDRLVREEGLKVFDYKEPVAPGTLLSTLNYGDLIHWGDQRERVVSETDEEVESVRQRMAYFEAATGLAHLLIGFGVLVRAATSPADRVFLP